MEKFGYTVNSKGFKVLPSYIRVIQGDGINYDTLGIILENMKKAGAQFTMPPTDVTASKIAMLNDTCGNLIQITELKRWQS